MDKDNILKHGFILFLGNAISSFLAYLYHFYAGRALGPADYGILGSLISIAYIIMVFSGAIQTTIAKFSSKYSVEKNYKGLNRLLFVSLKKLFVPSLVCFIVFAVLSPAIAWFLHIESAVLVVITGILFLFAFLSPVPLGMLQGLEDYKAMSALAVAGAFLKLLFVIALVSFGLGVFGAASSFILSNALIFFVSFIPLKFLFDKKSGIKIETGKMFSYSLQVFLISLCLMVMMNIDVILVKHFFSSEQAGYYTAASMFGKEIFFVSSAIALALFPKASKLDALKKKHFHLLKKSLLYTLGVGAFSTIIYFLMPDFIMSLFYGANYLPASGLLGLFGIAMSFFSLSYVLAFYKMSVNQTKFYPFLIFFAVLEVALIYLFHSSLAQVLFILTATMIGLFLAVFILTAKRAL